MAERERTAQASSPSQGTTMSAASSARAQAGRGPSRADQVVALISALNDLRCARQALEAQELNGSVDVVTEAAHRLRAQLAQLSDEVVGIIPLPELMGLRK